ncbi:phosphatase PAP2 family protein [Polymorphospora rubra]|uniref:phosphatase PAP2 family protein n=1 Tax=Polymorphospora rubra TaxID=338584 RepID=UPI0033C15A87
MAGDAWSGCPAPAPPGPVTGSALLGTAAAAAAGLAALTVAVVTRRPALVAADTAVARSAHHLAVRHPAVATAAARVTHLGDGRVVVGVLTATGVVLARHRRWRALALVAVAPAAGTLLCRAVRARVARTRPDGALRAADGYAFPSNHATNAALAAAAVTGVAWSRLPAPARPGVLAGALTVPAAVGATRVLLGVHWPSDVLAGWLVALTAVPAVAALARRRTAPHRPCRVWN